MRLSKALITHQEYCISFTLSATHLNMLFPLLLNCHAVLCTPQRTRNLDIVSLLWATSACSACVYTAHTAQAWAIWIALLQCNFLFSLLYFVFWMDSSLGAGRKEQYTVKKTRFHFLEIRFCTDFTESLYVIPLRKQLIDLHFSTDRNTTFFDLSSVLWLKGATFYKQAISSEGFQYHTAHNLGKKLNMQFRLFFEI